MNRDNLEPVGAVAGIDDPGSTGINDAGYNCDGN
jgi:hypothetical protein